MAAKELPSIDYDQLQQVTLFKGLPLEALQQICREGQAKKVAKGGFFFLQGDLAERTYLLLSGRIKLSQTTADGQSILMRDVRSLAV